MFVKQSLGRSGRALILATAAVALGLSTAPSTALPLPERASAKEVAKIAKEVDLPPIVPPTGKSTIPLDQRPFPAAALKGYEEEVPLETIQKPGNAEKYRFQLAVLDAVSTTRQLWKDDRLLVRKELVGEPTAAVKKTVSDEQVPVARAIAKLEAILEKLESVQPKRDEQANRWQANFDYALAGVLARLVYLQEYNLLLGQVRSENLPDLNPKKDQDGYRLTPAAKLQSGASIRRMGDRAQRLLDRVTKDHPFTPWAAAAKRDRAVPLGLEWVPVRLKAVRPK